MTMQLLLMSRVVFIFFYSSVQITGIDRRIKNESYAKEVRYLITLHKPNYLLPYTYNSAINTTGDTMELEDVKFNLTENIVIIGFIKSA